MADTADPAFSDVEDERSTYDTDSDGDTADVPIDGYFRRRNHPRELFVQSHTSRRSRDKAREARDERAAASAGTTRSSQLPSAPRLPDWDDDDDDDDSVPILDAGPVTKPPPDYAAATAYREQEERGKRAEPQTSLEAPNDEAWTFTNRTEVFDSEHPLVRNGLVGDRSNRESQEEHPIGPRQEHTFKSYSPDTDSEEGGEASALMGGRGTKHWKDGRPRQWICRLWRHCCVVFLVIALIGVVLSILSTNRHRTISGGLPSVPTDSVGLHPPTEVKALQYHRHIPGCEFTKFKSVSTDTSVTPDWPDLADPHVQRNISFLERISQRSGDVRLSGIVRVTSADEDQQNLVRFEIEVATTHGLTVEKVNSELLGPGRLGLSDPDLATDEAQGCMDFSVTIKINKGIYIDDFRINTSNFDIHVEDRDLFQQTFDPWMDFWEPSLSIQNTTVFHAERGNITGQGWISPRTEVHTRTGMITGTWPLRDSLILTSRDGNINVGVEPRNRTYKDRNYPDRWQELNARVAEYSATSEKGNIKNHIVRDEGITSVPDRDYITYVVTAEGDIRGDYLLGSTTSLKTTNGEMNVRIVPVDLGFSNVTLRTEDERELAYVWVLSPISPSSETADPHAPSLSSAKRLLRNSLHATHLTKSGAVAYTLPRIWAGTAQCTTDAGRIFVDDAYQVVQNETGKVVAVKNGGNSTVNLTSTTGELYLDMYYDWVPSESTESNAPQP